MKKTMLYIEQIFFSRIFRMVKRNFISPIKIKKSSFNTDSLNIDNLHNQYSSATPFPSIFIDGIFNESVLNKVLNDFPLPTDLKSNRWGGTSINKIQEGKIGTSNLSDYPSTILDLIFELSSTKFLIFLSKITGIRGLIPDPYLYGAGINQVLSGGFLKVHADFNIHPVMKTYRALNVLIYLNKDWEDSFGGHLELWDKEMKSCQKKIAPHFNRVAIFTTNATSYHGFPSPCKQPNHITRKAINLYYYTMEPTNGVMKESHSTLWQEIPHRTM